MKNFQIKTALNFLLLLVLTAFSACEDDHVDPENSAEITISNPADNGIVSEGQTVNIAGTIVGAHELHGYIINIRRKSDNVVVFSKSNDDHNANITINENWTVGTITEHTEMELEVVATLDHDGNTASKKITIHALPAGQTNFATITITSPTTNQVVNFGQTLNITGTINGLTTLHGFTINIRQQGDTTRIFTNKIHVHQANIEIAETWAVPVTQTNKDYELEVIGYLDHAGNTINKKVNFKAQQ
jgi:hypothetical protein